MQNQRKTYLDDYEILRALGSGYCGEVRLGKHKETGELVALKIFNKNHKDAKKIKYSIIKEGSYLRQIQHPNIIKLIDFSKTGVIKVDNQVVSEDNLYLCLELAPNKEIFDVISETGSFSENTTRYYGQQLIKVIQFLHDQNLVHRDLKPENILLGSKYELKLIDFGFLSFVEEGALNQTSLGTPGYKAPEIINGQKYDAKKADVFSFGVILYIFIKGRPPFIQADIKSDRYYYNMIKKPDYYWSAMDSDKLVSPQLRSLLQGCLAHEQDQRYTIQQILDSDFMKTQINEEEALKDMQKRLQIIHKSHQMQVEEDSDEEDEDDNQYRSHNNVHIDDEFESVSDDQLDNIMITKNVGGCKVCVIVDSNDKKQIINRMVQTFAALKEDYDIKYDFDKETKQIQVEIQKDQYQYKWRIELIQVNPNQIGFSVLLKEGDYFSSLQLKKKFCDTFKQKCSLQQEED